MGRLAVFLAVALLLAASGVSLGQATKYIIHLNNGGAVEADNYTTEKGTIRIVLPTGVIYLDKDLVKSVEEVKGVEEEPVQTMKVEPALPAQPAQPAGQTEKPKRRLQTPPPIPPAPLEETDDLGNNQAWWREKVGEWKGKRDDAQKRYIKAQKEWNRYNGLLMSISPGTPALGNITSAGVAQFDVVRYQDLRGAARVAMDKAKADLDEANRMLNEVLPDEARKAGAPPGWVR